LLQHFYHAVDMHEMVRKNNLKIIHLFLDFDF